MDIFEILSGMHDRGDHKRIIAVLEAMPPQRRGFELTSLLGRAYNNAGRYDSAIAVLRSVEDKGREDPLWNFRMGYSFFYRPHRANKLMGDLETAARYFSEAIRCGDTDPDTKELLEYCDRLMSRLYEHEDIIYEYGGRSLKSCCLK